MSDVASVTTTLVMLSSSSSSSIVTEMTSDDEWITASACLHLHHGQRALEQFSPNYTVFQKTCDHIFDNNLKQNCPFTKIFGTLVTKIIGHRQVYLVSHLTYLVQLLYFTLGNCQDLKIMNLALNCWFSQCYNTRILTAKLSPYYFTYLLFNLRFIIEQ